MIVILDYIRHTGSAPIDTDIQQYPTTYVVVDTPTSLHTHLVAHHAVKPHLPRANKFFYFFRYHHHQEDTSFR